MHAFPKVGIVVLNYNGRRCLLSCLQSLEALVYKEKDVIVIDNCSTDDSFEAAQKQFPHFTYVENERNEGFAKGMNVGMKLALLRGAKWCLIFNYDAIASPESLSSLILEAEKNEKAGLLSPIISGVQENRGKESQQIWFAKGKIKFFRMRTLHVNATPEELLAPSYSSEFLTGCALLIKKELIDTIGYLDENFFLYYEDADYSLRATRAGFTCLVVPGSRVAHSEESQMNNQKVFFLVHSGLIFFYKWASGPLKWYYALYVTMRRAKNLLDRVFKCSVSSEAVHRAYRKYFYER